MQVLNRSGGDNKMAFNLKGTIKQARDIVPEAGGLGLVLMIFALVIGAIAYVVINDSGVTVPAGYSSFANNTSHAAISWFVNILTAAGVIFGLVVIVLLIQLFKSWIQPPAKKSSGGSNRMFG